MHRVTIVCPGVAPHLGGKAAADIEAEFAAHRQHHRNVRCSFANGELTLSAENDFDRTGLALQDEFSDCISAFLRETPSGGDLFITSVVDIE